jgi:UDP-N-acetyl-D-glucosamine dehydrogenase
MTKLFENIFRNINIALVNEMKMLCHHMDIDIHEVIKAASTKPFGFMPFYPGPGLGGHCIPIDPFYLSYKAKEYDFSTRFIELAGEINSSMPYFVIQKISNALNKHKKSINDSKILVLGMAYKKNIDDERESPSYKIIKLLEEAGANVVYNDPYIPKLKPTRKYNFNYESVNITKELLSDMDCIVIVSNHDIYDYDFILKYSNIIVDTCNAYPN